MYARRTRPRPRAPRRLLQPRTVLLFLAAFLLLDSFLIINSVPTPHRVSLSDFAPLGHEKILLAAIFRNSEYMLRLYWMPALLALVQDLGVHNIFVSIIESGSQDGTKDALNELKFELEKLGVGNRIVLGQDASAQVEELESIPAEGRRQGWIFTGRGPEGWEKRRIPFLSEQRNRAMEPLMELQPNIRFEKVLWINDVVFTTEDVTTLLSTNNGHYAAACALDFSKSPNTYYDTFALRDSLGHKTATDSWPYFFTSDSLSAIRAGSAVPVRSCWNGMVVLDAAPFYEGLRFRGVDDALARHHVEASECCLIHADARRRGAAEAGVWLNPDVRVAYNKTTYDVVNAGTEGGRTPWPTKMQAWVGVWANRRARWMGWARRWSEERVVRRRVERWVREGREVRHGRQEGGMECLVNEMQVLFQNGWQHV